MYVFIFVNKRWRRSGSNAKAVTAASSVQTEKDRYTQDKIRENCKYFTQNKTIDKQMIFNDVLLLL